MTDFLLAEWLVYFRSDNRKILQIMQSYSTSDRFIGFDFLSFFVPLRTFHCRWISSWEHQVEALMIRFPLLLWLIEEAINFQFNGNTFWRRDSGVRKQHSSKYLQTFNFEKIKFIIYEILSVNLFERRFDPVIKLFWLYRFIPEQSKQLSWTSIYCICF